MCVSRTLMRCPLLSFYLGWGCGEVGRREEGREGFIVFEVRASFYFLLLPLRALGLEA